MPEVESVTIAGRVFNVASRYTEGHQLTAGEADQLNQVFRENIRNNLAKKIEGISDEDAQKRVDEYAAGYEFGVRAGGGGGPRDPVKVEAMRIAREQVKKAIQKAGKKVDDFSAKDITDRAAAELEKHPAWTEEAKRRIEASRSLAAETLDFNEAA